MLARNWAYGSSVMGPALPTMRLAQSGRAEVWLQDPAVSGVLGRVERERNHRQRISRRLQRFPRRENLRIPQ
ncbi:hypothetical protein, partial [Lacticaseibacillus rhamnosus]|uniref:hypothetical protein n=1 Tax=Lacticaseibacillus rhamnosus TaxID=47715 RepID=UPI0005CAA20A